MHPVRPLKSLFHPAIIFSIFGQALIHIACMSLAVKWATDAMGPEKLHEVTEFFRKVMLPSVMMHSFVFDGVLRRSKPMRSIAQSIAGRMISCANSIAFGWLHSSQTY